MPVMWTFRDIYGYTITPLNSFTNYEQPNMFLDASSVCGQQVLFLDIHNSVSQHPFFRDALAMHISTAH